MPTLARAILPDLIVAYLFKAIKGDQGTCLSLCVLCIRHMLTRPGNGRQATFSGALQDIVVTLMQIIPFDNSSTCTSYIPGICATGKGTAFDDHGGGHSINLAIVCEQ